MTPEHRRLSIALCVMFGVGALVLNDYRTAASAPAALAQSAAKRARDRIDMQPVGSSPGAVRDVSETAAGVTGALIPRATLIASATSNAASVDLFAGRDWTPAPPPPQTVPVAVSEPQAPSWPYVLLGKFHDDQGWQVFLGRGELTALAREGQVVGEGFRIESIAPPDMKLLYVPLGQEMHVNIGESD